MILRGGREREGEMGRGIKRVEIEIVIRGERMEGGCNRGEK